MINCLKRYFFNRGIFKIFAITIVLLALVTIGKAQVAEPVNWILAATKTSVDTYEATFKAVLKTGWHMYSQFTPDGGPVPTSYRFIKNPLVELNGAVKEAGKLEHIYEPLFGVDVKQFSGTVMFTQKVKLKVPVNTRVVGRIKFMLCDERRCLPPAEQQFSIALN